MGNSKLHHLGAQGTFKGPTGQCATRVNRVNTHKLASDIWVGVARDELQLPLLHDAGTGHHAYNRTKKNGPTIRIYMIYE